MQEGAEARPSGRRCNVPGGMWAGLASFPSPAYNPLPSPLLALSPGLAQCSVLIPREGSHSHQTNIGTSGRTEEPPNASQAGDERMGWAEEGEMKTWPWVSEV